MTSAEIESGLFLLSDEKYRDFQAKLIPNIPKEKIMGVRIPDLRKFAKELYKGGEYGDFLDVLPHKYYDEMNLHGLLIAEEKDYDTVVKKLDLFLPFVDNWASCDTISPKKAFDKNTDRLINDIKRWMDSDRTYVCRFGMKMLMSYFLNDRFEKEYLEWVLAISSDEYYINMMRAWFFATALAKQYEETLPVLEKHLLDEWTHKKTIQKAIESFRISGERKSYLKHLINKSPANSCALAQ